MIKAMKSFKAVLTAAAALWLVCLLPRIVVHGDGSLNHQLLLHQQKQHRSLKLFQHGIQALSETKKGKIIPRNELEQIIVNDRTAKRAAALENKKNKNDDKKDDDHHHSLFSKKSSFRNPNRQTSNKHETVVQSKSNDPESLFVPTSTQPQQQQVKKLFSPRQVVSTKKSSSSSSSHKSVIFDPLHPSSKQKKSVNDVVDQHVASFKQSQRNLQEFLSCQFFLDLLNGPEMTCRCEETETGGSLLTCDDLLCQTCETFEAESCYTNGFTREIGMFGDTISEGGYLVNQVTNDTLSIAYFNNNTACNVSMNGIQCSSCVPNDFCGPDEFSSGVIVSCPEVEEGLSFEICEGEDYLNHTIPEGSIFEFTLWDVEICEVSPLEECFEAQYQDPDQTCQCQPSNSSSAYYLVCVDSCGVRCNDENTVCGVSGIERQFGNDTAPVVNYFEYVLGGDDFLALLLYDEEIDEFGEARYDTCEFIVSDERCNNCTLQDCVDSSGNYTYQEALIDCENIEPGATFDFCQGEVFVDTGIFEALSTNEFNDCAPLGELQCEFDAMLFESDIDAQWLCTCSSFFGEVMLSCVDTCGEQCNIDQDICGRDRFTQTYLPSGGVISTSQIFDYRIGRTEEITIQIDPFGCQVTVDFEVCNSCILSSCGGGNFSIPYFDCSNIFDGGIVDFCAANPNVDNSLLFAYLEPGGLGGGCIDLSAENDVCSDFAEPIIPNGDIVIAGSTTFSTPTLLSESICVSSAEPDTYPSLWYTVVGTDRGLQASTCADQTTFDTAIEVYEGSCDALSCVGFNDDDFDFCPTYALSSRVTWYGENGVLYYIRVRGLRSDQTGDFGLVVEEINLPLSECERGALSFESADPITGASCTCDVNGEFEAFLTCNDNCEYCNNATTTCAVETFQAIYNEFGKVAIAYDTTTYIKGETGTVQVQHYGCSDMFSCSFCDVFVNDTVCNSCSPTFCIGPDVFFEDGYIVDCSNIEAGASFSTCDASTVPDTGALQVFSPLEFEICRQDPLQSCIATINSTTTSIGFGDVCSCEANDFGATLTCEETFCVYCNLDGTLCARRSYGSIFNQLGQFYTEFRTYEFFLGSDDVIVETDVQQFDQCGVTLNGEECICGFDDSFAIFIDCGVGGTYSERYGNGTSETLSIVRSSNFGCRFATDPVADCNNELSVNQGLYNCECTPIMETGGQRLICLEPNCLYCNAEREVCVERGFGRDFNIFGQGDNFEVYGYENGDIVTNIPSTATNDGTFCFLPALNGISCNGCSTMDCFGLFGPFLAYQYDCENIEVGASFGGNCDTEGDIKVDSGPFQVFSAGEFGICLNPSADPEALCLERASVMEDNGKEFCECTFNPFTLGYDLFCANPSCVLCDENVEYCGIEISGASINRFAEFPDFYSGFQYVNGTSDTITFVSASGPIGLQTCTASLNGNECESCEVSPCEYFGNGFAGIYLSQKATCGSVVYSDCVGDWATGGVLPVFIENTGITPCSADPLTTCLIELNATTTSNNEMGITCSCEPNNDNGHVDFICTGEPCEYCTLDRSTCIVYGATGSVFNEVGRRSGEYYYYKFTQGRNESVAIERIGSDDCVVSVDGNLCSSCIRSECSHPFFGTQERTTIDCGDYGVVDCDSITGVFEPLSNILGTGGISFDYQLCLDYNGTFPPLPTDSPSQVPSSYPSSAPSFTPSSLPSDLPSALPSSSPSPQPSMDTATMPSEPSAPSSPVATPTDAPAGTPTDSPTSADRGGVSAASNIFSVSFVTTTTTIMGLMSMLLLSSIGL